MMDITNPMWKRKANTAYTENNFRPFCPSFKQTNLRQGKFKTIP